MVALDFHDPQAIDALRELLADADLVLESSRPRALAQLGIEAAEIVAAGTSWLSITARGRDDDGIGFGDDVAAAAGFVVADGTDLLPCGDALADPLAGVRAAASASTALLAERACLIDVSMLHVAAEAAAGPPAEEHCVHFNDDTWWVHTSGGRFPVHDPVARTPRVARRRTRCGQRPVARKAVIRPAVSQCRGGRRARRCDASPVHGSPRSAPNWPPKTTRRFSTVAEGCSCRGCTTITCTCWRLPPLVGRSTADRLRYATRPDCSTR